MHFVDHVGLCTSQMVVADGQGHGRITLLKMIQLLMSISQKHFPWLGAVTSDPHVDDTDGIGPAQNMNMWPCVVERPC